jgi:purine-binding chemotaxis protein CheW
MATGLQMTAAEPSGAEGRQEVQIACFRVGDGFYALDIMRIREIIRPQKLTAVPKAPQFIEGVIHLRGAVIPVSDLRKRFDQPAAEVTGKNRIIICSIGGRIVGLLVDEVLEVRRCARPEIAPAPQFFKGPEAAFLLGVARRGDDLVMILDLDRILTTDEQVALGKLA